MGFKSNRPFFIYVLMCPFTGRVGYVGKTQIPEQRKALHKYATGVERVAKWKRSIIAKQERVEFRIVEQLNPSPGFRKDASRRESRWILYFRKKNQPLTNSYLSKY